MSKIEIIYLGSKEPDTVYINTKEPEVFEVIDEEIEKNINLEPQVRVSIEKQVEKKKPKKPKQQHKHLKRVLPIFFAFFVFAIIFFNMGYLPIKAFLHTPKPIACAGEINVDQYLHHYPNLKNIPKLNNIEYKVYVSDASIDTVAEDYKYQLKEEGYSLDYEGTVTKKGITFKYLGFVKGITAVGILLTDDIEQLLGHETAVLSTIGNIFDYKEVIQWYRTNVKN